VEIDLIEPGYIVQITGNVELPFMVAEQLVPDRNGIRKIQIVAFDLSVIDLVECGVKATAEVYNTGIWVCIQISTTGACHIILSGRTHNAADISQHTFHIVRNCKINSIEKRLAVMIHEEIRIEIHSIFSSIQRNQQCFLYGSFFNLNFFHVLGPPVFLFQVPLPVREAEYSLPLKMPVCSQM